MAFWTHVVDASRTQLHADFLGGRQSKIGNCNTITVIEAEDILRLQITMIYAERMTIFNCVEQLQKYVLDQRIIPDIATVIQDLREEIIIRRIIHDDVRVVSLVHDTM